MSAGRCQVCGRRRAERSAGGLVKHYVRGVPCPGVGFPPLERDDHRLEGYLAELDVAIAEARRQLRELEDRRANYIPPALVERRNELSRTRDRIAGRLSRHRGWPGRYRRSLERYGYALPPPAYLLEREGLEQ